MSFPRTRMRDAAQRNAAAHGARDAALARRPGAAALRGRGQRRARGRSRRCRACSASRSTSSCSRRKQVADLGMPAVILFGVPGREGRARLAAPTPRAASCSARSAAMKRASARPRRDHRRVPVRVHRPRPLRGRAKASDVANDASVERLAATALSHARAGADIVAPSDMMDGRVAAIRRASTHAASRTSRSSPTPRSSRAPTTDPFREAAESTPAFGDRRGYQMDPPNRREALREMRARPRGGRGHADGEAGARRISTCWPTRAASSTCRSPRITCRASTR